MRSLKKYLTMQCVGWVDFQKRFFTKVFKNKTKSRHNKKSTSISGRNLSYLEAAKKNYFIDKYQYYFDGMLLLIVAGIGCIGTILSLIVLLRPKNRDIFSNFFTALSFFDCSFLFLAALYVGLPAISFE